MSYDALVTAIVAIVSQVYEKAMENIPEEHKETIVTRLGRSARCPGDGKKACFFKQSIIAGPIIVQEGTPRLLR